MFRILKFTEPFRKAKMIESLLTCELIWKSEEKALNQMKRKADAGLGVDSGTYQNGHVIFMSFS